MTTPVTTPWILAFPLVWFLAYWAVWHYWVPSLFLPLGVLWLVVPLSFGWLGALMLNRTSSDLDRSERLILFVPSAAIVLAAYGSCLYCLGALSNVITEHYKFGNDSTLLSYSTVVIWASGSGVCLTASLAVLHFQRRRTLSRSLVSASIGMLVAAAVLMGGLLLSGRVVFRP